MPTENGRPKRAGEQGRAPGLARALALFVVLLLLFPALGILVQLCTQGPDALHGWQWGLLMLLPGLLWVWGRHYSILGCGGACPPPGEDRQHHRGVL